MSKKYEKLKSLLKELFQLDQPDLDFGLYRIMHAKSAEITQFLDRDLLPQVREEFAQYKTADKSDLEAQLAKAIEQAQQLGADPESLPKVKELREKIASDSVDLAGLESEVYDHLYGFFRRYYSEGDFLSKRVYKPGVYAIPYEGEEVKLHWANADQYYIKTSEYLRDYAFRLHPDDEQKPMRVHFRLVDAAEGEHGNVKAANGKDRIFLLASKEFAAIEEGEQGPELVLRFEYRPATLTDWPDDVRDGKKKPPTQKEMTELAESRIIAAGGELADWIKELGKPHEKADGELADYSRLRAHLNRYVARNTFDYFIHKDLGGFLRRELDFYIKNEVMHLDDIEGQQAPRVEQYLSKIRVIRRIATKIITFLAHLEDFQKKLWLKKKFVVETNYCIAVGSIPEEFYPEIAANDAQRQEWVELLAINEIEKDLTSPGYSEPLNIELLKGHPTMMVDTRHFPMPFVERLISSFGALDDALDGVLLHSENSHALSLMQSRYRGRADLAYLDPPYNTSEIGFLYKNEYRHSSWLSMIAQTHHAMLPILADEGLESIAIDDEELFNLALAIETSVPSLKRIGTLVVEIKPSGRTNDSFLSTSHEYYLWHSKSPDTAAISFFDLDSESAAAYEHRDDSGEYKWRDFLRTGGYSTPQERPNSYYAIYYRSSDGEISTDPIQGAIEILPLDSTGSKRVWRKTIPSFLSHVEAGDIRIEQTRGGIWKVRIKDRIKAGTRPKSVWVGAKYDAASHGTKLLKAMFGEIGAFSFPKSMYAVFDAVWVATKDKEDAVILDCFAGSGTTGHSVLNLNREDGGRRKVVLVEMADYFDTVLLPRLKKVAFTPEWKEGKPKRLPTAEESERGPKVYKYVRLESYEDALNNLQLRRSRAQQTLLDAAQNTEASRLKEQYMLGYMLNVETEGSQSLLNVQAFTDPTTYKLKVKRPGSDETREVNVDLLETFNWLIGLTVDHIAAPRQFSAQFERDAEGRLRLKGRLKQEDEGPYWFRTVTGTTPDGRKTLVIWRKRPGGETPEGVEQDNLVLDEWFTKQGYSSKDSEFDLIYVNGTNNLENLRTPEDLWKVRLIEEDFHRLMFSAEGV